MNEQKTLLAKATTEQVEQLDAMVKKMGLIKESDYCEFYEEYNDLILSYDWSDIVFEENGKKWLMNVKGDVVVPAIYDDFSDLAPYYEYPMKVIAYLDGKAALVKRDGKGTPITEFEFTHVERISFSPFMQYARRISHTLPCCIKVRSSRLMNLKPMMQQSMAASCLVRMVKEDSSIMLTNFFTSNPNTITSMTRASVATSSLLIATLSQIS